MNVTDRPPKRSYVKKLTEAFSDSFFQDGPVIGVTVIAIFACLAYISFTAILDKIETIKGTTLDVGNVFSVTLPCKGAATFPPQSDVGAIVSSYDCPNSEKGYSYDAKAYIQDGSNSLSSIYDINCDNNREHTNQTFNSISFSICPTTDHTEVQAIGLNTLGNEMIVISVSDENGPPDETNLYNHLNSVIKTAFFD